MRQNILWVKQERGFSQITRFAGSMSKCMHAVKQLDIRPEQVKGKPSEAKVEAIIKRESLFHEGI